MELKTPNERVRSFYTGFQLSMWQWRHSIYFAIIAMSEKSHVNIFRIQNFVLNMKNACKLH